MALQKFLAFIAGRTQVVSPVDDSTGVADAGKIVALGSDGKLPLTMMPAGMGPDVMSVTCSENISAGGFVNIFDEGGTAKARKADSVVGKEADGFILDTGVMGQPVTVYFEGRNTALTGLTQGARYYLSDTVPGGVTLTAPTAQGKVCQYLGKAIGATSLTYEATDGIVL